MMRSPVIDVQALPQAVDLERQLLTVEERLCSLGEALHQQDADAVVRVAAELHAALVHAVDHFSLAARHGGVPPPLRRRLAAAGGQVAAQREALARATASLDRAIDVLIPRRTPNGLYSAVGNADRARAGSGAVLA